MTDSEIVSFRIDADDLERVDQIAKNGPWENRTECILFAIKQLLEQDWHEKIESLRAMEAHLTDEQQIVFDGSIGQLHRLADAAEDSTQIPLADGGRDPSNWDRQIRRETALFGDAIEAFGEDAQFIKSAEEFAELAAALNRYLLGQEDWPTVLEEAVDARIMLEQLRIMGADGSNEYLESYTGTRLERLEGMVAEEEVAADD